MPSATLNQISQQIEANGTDHFSQFYAYAGLLNLVSVRTPGVSFFTVQPETTPLLFGNKKRLNLGQFDEAFQTAVNTYQGTFAPTSDALTALQKIVMTYARKGQLADLVFIVDKMLAHLSKTVEPTNQNNKSIYNTINFDIKKDAIYEFINNVSRLNHQILTGTDSITNAGISGAVAISGLVIVLASVFSLAGIIIGGAMLIGGALSAYNYVQQARVLAGQLEQNARVLVESMETMQATMSTFEHVVSDNHKSFVMHGIVKPMLFGAVTVFEQVCPDEEAARHAAGVREEMSQLVRRIG